MQTVPLPELPQGGFRHELVGQLADERSRRQPTSRPMASYEGGLGVCRNPCRCWLSGDGPRQYAHCDMVLLGALILGGGLALLLRFRKEKGQAAQ